MFDLTTEQLISIIAIAIIEDESIQYSDAEY